MNRELQRLVRRAPLAAFFVLAYALSGMLLIPFVHVWHNVVDEQFAWWMLVFLPGGYGPTLAAIAVTSMTRGQRGMRRLLCKYCHWRAPPGWWTFVMAAPLCLTATSIALSSFAPQAAASFDLSRAWKVVPLWLAVALPFGPLAEELGWRGYALPRLLAKHGVVTSSLIVGVLWTFWHTPMFWFPGAAIPSCLDLNPGSVLLYLADLCAGSIVFTVVYLHTGGSIPVAITLHLFQNAASNIAFGLTSEPSVEQARQIYYTSVVLSVVLAIAMMVGHLVFSGGKRGRGCVTAGRRAFRGRKATTEDSNGRSEHGT